MLTLENGSQILPSANASVIAVATADTDARCERIILWLQVQTECDEDPHEKYSNKISYLSTWREQENGLFASNHANVWSATKSVYELV